ncbi:MAG: transcriptional repressor [Clostridia bacterium]|nr:transcriptional repressor [Clostridia bacterium]
MSYICSDKEIKRILKKNGYKLTPQRQAVMEIIKKFNGNHLTREEIYLLVKDIFPQIGLATIYRTIQIFEDTGIIQSVYLDDGCSRYQLANPDEEHEHHHLICQMCGNVMDIKEDLLENLEMQVLAKKGFKVIDHRVILYGICKNCNEKI